ncbi:hypothetical protein CANINC_004715 [Pichia inconspicua]|uniref:ditrans,polycis-polyprenyl diphosphate synthase [(2E,6E)-farnesyldiphosphate specific] n=1 Tax=Pichia inconspicua TaxID=52247 RepID=A0A4T0WW90_9ASCO|nr:hypothetical protein CANINC_004715 [[Candida] inconspicua]
MIENIEKVTNMDVGKDISSGFEISGNEHQQIVQQTRARVNGNNEKNDRNDKDKIVEIPIYVKNTFVECINGIIRSLFLPQDELVLKRWYSNPSKPQFQEIITFYFYRFILTTFYLIFSIYSLFEYTVNRSKIKFLSMAYKSDDDPSIINSDINKLPKIPQRLAVILNYKSEQEEGGGIEGLCNDSALNAAWCVSGGIPDLTIYEVTGTLKKSINELNSAILRKFEAYFGTESMPNYLIKIPHLNQVYAGVRGELIDKTETGVEKDEEYQINITLLSKVDGRSTIVELTKVMALMTKNGELKQSDITIKFIDRELKQLVGEEPDLIVMFTPYLDLQGFPPWHIRLSEMYWEPDNETVSYIVFLRALQKYSTCKVNIGR